MATLTLVRHAQASLRSNNYDQLSDLGHIQANLLGEYLAKQSYAPSKIICGSLVRHIETTEAIKNKTGSAVNIDTDERWNEFDFKSLLRAYQQLDDVETFQFTPETHASVFFKLLKKAMLAWSEGRLSNFDIESWPNFEQRVTSALSDILKATQQSESVLLVSSGGAISMALKHILDLDVNRMVDLNFQIKNASFSSMEIKRDRYVLSGFNQTPHLDKAHTSYA